MTIRYPGGSPSAGLATEVAVGHGVRAKDVCGLVGAAVPADRRRPAREHGSDTDRDDDRTSDDRRLEIAPHHWRDQTAGAVQRPITIVSLWVKTRPTGRGKGNDIERSAVTPASSRIAVIAVASRNVTWVASEA